MIIAWRALRLVMACVSFSAFFGLFSASAAASSSLAAVSLSPTWSEGANKGEGWVWGRGWGLGWVLADLLTELLLLAHGDLAVFDHGLTMRT
jgi:hypothetical protein